MSFVLCIIDNYDKMINFYGTSDQEMCSHSIYVCN